MAAVMPYARHRLSGVQRRFGLESGFVSIAPDQANHRLELRSSREGVEPLQLKLDDAELADLVRCLDRLRLDNRVKLTWTFPEDRPLKRQEIVDRIPLQKRLGPPLLAGGCSGMQHRHRMACSSASGNQGDNVSTGTGGQA